MQIIDILINIFFANKSLYITEKFCSFSRQFWKSLCNPISVITFGKTELVMVSFAYIVYLLLNCQSACWVDTRN